MCLILASNVTEGIRNTTTVFDTNDIDRIRLPRFVADDKILRVYQQREALGQSWLKEVNNGRYLLQGILCTLGYTPHLLGSALSGGPPQDRLTGKGDGWVGWL